ncbi:geranylgeranylglycerol-phosphate geranylgeranyltransferase [Oculatella sp. LEGE 06141]|uniref:geranylgeranylglycerol-phosphate geranylgeranyltransferase n=1 Tax=Oculatella sp. LEGE 06141 TaxID=1828648 RepID=UPI0018816CDA|nr:geranylgeranylglycerol-phosphate geranylgeranyltransferase [Oculatella sp. LEGE 06141]MBE9181682.1 geranylgeranylglycerol-phosphate geranylgeranyltransferase [Oculatella sp. LEGE 06141]
MITPSSPHDSGGGKDLVNAFAQLFRLPVAILAALAGFATVYALNPTAPPYQSVLTATVLACMYAAACAINDYWDLDKDRIDHPERPLPSQRLSPQQAYWAAVTLFIAALIAAVPLGTYALLLVAVSTVLLWHYSHLLVYNGILGNGIVAAIVATLIFLGSVVVDRPFAMLYPTAFLFFYTLAKEIVWDIHDAEGDRQQGIATIANQLGDRVAFLFAWGLIDILIGSIPIALLLLPMTSPLLFALFSLSMMVCLGMGLIAYQQQRSQRAYESLIGLERLSMLLGVIGMLGTAPPD